MTQPTVIHFGPDTPPARDCPPPPKINLRTLLFATSRRGRVIESMHVRLTRNEMHQNFNIWVHGDATLVRGSGLSSSGTHGWPPEALSSDDLLFGTFLRIAKVLRRPYCL